MKVTAPEGLNVWIWEAKDNEYISYHFYATNNKKTAKVRGLIMFNAGDHAKAKAYLEQILKSIAFK